MRQRFGRALSLVLISLGVAAGIALSASPLQAHVTSRFRHLWTAHVQPNADARYLPGATLPSGVTLRGTWKVGGENPSGGVAAHAVGDISFGYTFVAAPTVQFIPLAGPFTAECPGTIDAPTALPGYLCIYEEDYGHNDWLRWDPPKAFGVNLFLFSLPGAGPFWTRGTWAATSP